MTHPSNEPALGPRAETLRKRAIVEVRSGPMLGVKAVIEPGESLRLGRTERAHLVVARDQQMSGLHCTLTWDGARCRLRDEKSARGTLLGGEPIEAEVEVPNGAWIQAGETSFSVYLEDHTPPRDDTPPRDPAIAAMAPIALARLREAPPRLYALLDAARDERILQVLHESIDDHRSLYDGVKGEALATEAPYLVVFRRDSSLLERLVTEGWGRSWGVFVVSKLGFTAVRRHFRRFLMVENDETDERMYFRFYDPRVLREMLPIATVRQKDLIFDGVDAFLLEGERGEVLAFEPPPKVEEG